MVVPAHAGTGPDGLGEPNERANGDSHDAQRAWAEYRPDARRPWTIQRVGHLFRRAAFGATAKQLDAALASGPKSAIDTLVRPEVDVAAFDQALDRDEDAVARSGGVAALRSWWLRRMVQTPHPLQEKMTLFWHSHFGAGNSRVNSGELMARHVRTLRQQALGSYRHLLESVARDPAVLLAMGAKENRKAQPNENFTRQLMEQFSLGPGEFGDEDVREAARAFTGWFVLRGRLRYMAHEHDPGAKQVLGHRGDWTRDDIVRIVLEQPAAPRLLARKLYRWFISEVDEPSGDLLDPLADMLAKDYNIGQVVETILRSNLFFSDKCYRRRIKSPVEYSLGIVRVFGQTIPTNPLGAALADLGQNLYDPPTSHGWQGGRHWLNAVTMLRRQNLAAALLAPEGAYGGKLDPAKLAQQEGHSRARDAAAFLLRLYVQDDVPAEVKSQLLAGVDAVSGQKQSAWLRSFTYRVVTLPEFQLC